MAGIDIDIRKVRNINNMLPPLSMKLSGMKRGLKLLRWRVPEEVQGEMELEPRMEELLHELERAEAEINEIYSVTNSCISQIANLENDLTANAEKFE